MQRRMSQLSATVHPEGGARLVRAYASTPNRRTIAKCDTRDGEKHDLRLATYDLRLGTGNWELGTRYLQQRRPGCRYLSNGPRHAD